MTTRRRPVSPQAREARRRKRHRQVIRNRIIFAVACLLILSLIVFGIVKLVGTIKRVTATAETSTITFLDDGKVIFEEIEDFPQDTYSKKDFKKYTKELIKDFNESNKDSQVELKKIDFDKDNCYVKSAYSSAEAYSSFSSYKTYYGTIEQAFDKGYKFADSFAEVIDGTKGQVLATDILNEYAGCYVVIVNENVNVKVPGDILYITDANTDVVDTDEVSISPPNGNADATNTVYIIFSMKNSK